MKRRSLSPVDPPARGASVEEAVAAFVHRADPDADVNVLGREAQADGLLVEVTCSIPKGPNMDRDECDWEVTALLKHGDGGFEVVAAVRWWRGYEKS
jgi:hypothetical protein